MSFPSLIEDDCAQTSDEDGFYNCIAHAANDKAHWWEPGNPIYNYWPEGVPRIKRLDTYEAAFGKLGYVKCESDELEDGLEKIAIFVHTDNTPSHAARQLEDGKWTSKIGQWEDISHPLRQLEGEVYGKVKTIMARKRQTNS